MRRNDRAARLSSPRSIRVAIATPATLPHLPRRPTISDLDPPIGPYEHLEGVLGAYDGPVTVDALLTALDGVHA